FPLESSRSIAQRIPRNRYRWPAHNPDDKWKLVWVGAPNAAPLLSAALALRGRRIRGRRHDIELCLLVVIQLGVEIWRPRANGIHGIRRGHKPRLDGGEPRVWRVPHLARAGALQLPSSILRCLLQRVESFQLLPARLQHLFNALHRKFGYIARL